LLLKLEAEKNGTPLPVEAGNGNGGGAAAAGKGGGNLIEVDEDEELETRKKGKNNRQRSQSPSNNAAKPTTTAPVVKPPNDDVFATIPPPEATSSRSTGRFEVASPPASNSKVDPFADMTNSTKQASVPFDNFSIFDQKPSATTQKPSPTVDSFDVFGSSSTTSTNDDVFGQAPPPVGFNPFDFDETSSYVAPPSDQVVNGFDDDLPPVPTPVPKIPVLRAPSNGDSQQNK
jgi:hypothetical protein